MKSEQECIFCSKELIKDDILWQTPSFFVKVGIGILSPGHVMIVPVNHISCYGELLRQASSSLISEFFQLKEYIMQSIRLNFADPFMYEHGIYSQSIKHAHIHLMPGKNSYFNLKNISSKIFPDLQSTPIENITDISKIYEAEGSYFYFGDDRQNLVFHTSGLKDRKHTFRKEFGRLTGITGLQEWHNLKGEQIERDNEWKNETKQLMKK